MHGPGTTIVIADDHPLFRGALRQAIASLMPTSRVVEANGMEALNETLGAEKEVDLILLDLTMPGVQGFSGLISLRAQYPELPVVIVSARASRRKGDMSKRRLVIDCDITGSTR